MVESVGLAPPGTSQSFLTAAAGLGFPCQAPSGPICHQFWRVTADVPKELAAVSLQMEVGGM